jgi:opacity protein-like surface antigen
MRPTAALVFLSLLLLAPAAAGAQSFGVGARLAMVRADVDADAESSRFTGGHIRARMSPRTALEVAVDRRTQTSEDATSRTREYPVQGSLLLFPADAPFAPYVLGGAGWYTTRFETLSGDDTLTSESTRKFGWHAGFGAELRLGRHAGVHADYRYTFLRFGDDDEAEPESGIRRFLPSHDGSMWTAGLTIYF